MGRIYKVEDTELAAVANLIKQLRGSSQSTLYKWPNDFTSNLTSLKNLIDQILVNYNVNSLNSTIVSTINGMQARIAELEENNNNDSDHTVEAILECLYVLRLLSSTEEEQEEFLEDTDYESMDSLRVEYEELIDEADEAELNGETLTPVQEAVLICADLLEKLDNRDFQEVIVTSTLRGEQIRTGIEEIESRYRQNYTEEELEENGFVIYVTKALFDSRMSFLSCGVVDGEIADSIYYYRNIEPNFLATKTGPPDVVVINAGANLLRIVLKEVEPDAQV